ncbi:unnamed protein product [Cladocopium goreaui]|uniref:Uncharacterized protein n=1 Tax=Cladocopium goreaui TaxID=2562237 RepID=A0A9P1C748_9DINO|nr:unnamed protein product [Cladocopium goreaui]
MAREYPGGQRAVEAKPTPFPGQLFGNDRADASGVAAGQSVGPLCHGLGRVTLDGGTTSWLRNAVPCKSGAAGCAISHGIVFGCWDPASEHGIHWDSL